MRNDDDSCQSCTETLRMVLGRFMIDINPAIDASREFPSEPNALMSNAISNLLNIKSEAKH